MSSLVPSALRASPVKVSDTALRKGKHRNGRCGRRVVRIVVRHLVGASLMRLMRLMRVVCVCSYALGRARVRVHKLGRDIDGEGPNALPQAGDEIPRTPLQNWMRTPGILPS
jgi:hypothetical protein